MPNKEHVSILKRGAKEWNEWRKHRPKTRPDLSEADLTMTDLTGADLRNANLRGADLSGAILRDADLSKADLSGAIFGRLGLPRANFGGTVFAGANLSRANLDEVDLLGQDLRGVNLSGTRLQGAVLRMARLNEADLSKTDLSEVDLSGADLLGANLTGAELRRTDLSNADLSGAILTEASLEGVVLVGANMEGVDLTRSRCGNILFANLDLSSTKGLETIGHFLPSTVGVDTLFNSHGKIPEVFLRGCGMPENLIAYLPSLTGKVIEFYSCFISYSHADKDFARLLHDRLQGEGIRCWLDEHQLKPGDPLHSTIFEAIRMYDKIVLCCSKTSLTSWWVEKEFSRGIRKEEDFRQPLIIPLNLDGYLFSSECTGWVADEVKQRLAQDFTGWKSHDEFARAAERVIKALRTDGGNQPPPFSKLRRKS